MLHTLEKPHTAQSKQERRLSSHVFPIAAVGFALVLTGCGGGSGDGDGSSSSSDDDESAVVASNDGSNGTLVTSGQFAGLDQNCVDMLLGLGAPTLTIELSCRPENIETDTSTSVTDTPTPVSGPQDERHARASPGYQHFTHTDTEHCTSR